ncbi:S-layer homology domain-containing protein [Acetivibrio saccincola]|uniref:Cellulosome-anchoring protein n=1 Tax=Acetivibrio saccincola TaxID=1677857 RepID=A0A2K9E4T0_9FIRM|nr:S-layer homology domain-containing protein [Acetivibrio saccincola]AUG56476.1 Cellulosome-anchoring protein precursor [Acetivibrio saccincola]
MKVKKISIAYISVFIIVSILISISLFSIPAMANSNISVKVATVEAKVGERIEVPVSFSNLPDSGINNCDFRLKYDKDVLEIVELKPGKIVTNPNINFRYNINDPGKVAVMFVDETGVGKELIKEDGDFIILVFKVNDSAKNGMSYIELTSRLTISGYDLVLLPTDFVKGGVKVSGGKDIAPTDNDEDDAQDEISDNEDSDVNDQNEPDSLIPGSRKEGIHKAYLKGYPDGNFKPENSITRAEAAVIFANLLEVDQNAQPKSSISYTDLPNDHWAAWAVRYVSELGLFSGYPDGTFKPNNRITRAEFSTVVLKYLEMEEPQQVKNKFDDCIGHWAQKYIEKLSDSGYINGYPDGTFKPQNSIKRAESVALINRALNRGPLYGVKENFPDVPSTYWAYGDIAKGAITHRYYIDEEGREVFLEKIEN